MSKLVEAAVEFLSRDTSTKQTRLSEEENGLKKYPTDSHLHMEVFNGEERDVIKGVKHSAKNAKEIRDRIIHGVAQKTGFHVNDVKKHMNPAVGHDGENNNFTYTHTAAPDPKNTHEYDPRVFKNADEYVKHHVEHDSKTVKEFHQMYGHLKPRGE